MTAFTFARMTADDLPLVRSWREQPHVRRWWGEPDVEPEADKLAHPDIDALIVSLAGSPFAFVQDYRVHAWDGHPFAYLPRGARGLDLFIGEPGLMGRGHGSALLRDYVSRRFAEGVPAFGIDPHPDNIAARKAFEKAGFVAVSGPVDTLWGSAILMERRA